MQRQRTSIGLNANADAINIVTTNTTKFTSMSREKKQGSSNSLQSSMSSLSSDPSKDYDADTSNSGNVRRIEDSDYDDGVIATTAVDDDCDDDSGSNEQRTRNKKRRFFWTNDLHSLFLTSIFDIGLAHASSTNLLTTIHNNGANFVEPEDLKNHLHLYRNNARFTRKSFRDQLGTALTTHMERFVVKKNLNPLFHAYPMPAGDFPIMQLPEKEMLEEGVDVFPPYANTTQWEFPTYVPSAVDIDTKNVYSYNPQDVLSTTSSSFGYVRHPIGDVVEETYLFQHKPSMNITDLGEKMFPGDGEDTSSPKKKKKKRQLNTQGFNQSTLADGTSQKETEKEHQLNSTPMQTGNAIRASKSDIWKSNDSSLHLTVADKLDHDQSKPSELSNLDAQFSLRKGSLSEFSPGPHIIQSTHYSLLLNTNRIRLDSSSRLSLPDGIVQEAADWQSMKEEFSWLLEE